MQHARVVKPVDVDSNNPTVYLTDFALRLLAEGDSWFSLGSVPSHNMLEEMQFDESAVILSLAYPGDEVTEMFRRMFDWGAEFAQYLTMRSTWRFDAILMSGGGNDLIAAFPFLLRGDLTPDRIDPARPGDVIDHDALAKLDHYLLESYTGFVNVRDQPDSPNRDVPIFIHTYDYPTPNDAPTRILGARVGSAWLYPRLNGRLPQAAWVPVTNYLIDHLAETLLSLPARLPHVHVVDTRGTLMRAHPGATGSSGDWENEIHPSKGGYRKLAAKVVAVVQAKLAA
jgi:lysophospholipase L1-like esterase